MATLKIMSPEWYPEPGRNLTPMECYEHGWQAAIAYIKENYTLCEKEPCEVLVKTTNASGAVEFIPLYREAK